ncbi:MAG TPA: AtpZ/AtpI family protein [Longimicrobiales bacterium]|nr:AtpZ/AtpI family protein [Longimicrobiales bacterium]
MDTRGSRGSPPPEAGRYLGIGMTWALSTALFLYLGSRVDRWVGTESLFTLIGAFVGAAAGFYYMYYHLVVEPRQRAARKKREEES